MHIYKPSPSSDHSSLGLKILAIITAVWVVIIIGLLTSIGQTIGSFISVILSIIVLAPLFLLSDITDINMMTFLKGLVFVYSAVTIYAFLLGGFCAARKDWISAYTSWVICVCLIGFAISTYINFDTIETWVN